MNRKAAAATVAGLAALVALQVSRGPEPDRSNQIQSDPIRSNQIQSPLVQPAGHETLTLGIGVRTAGSEPPAVVESTPLLRADASSVSASPAAVVTATAATPHPSSTIPITLPIPVIARRVMKIRWQYGAVNGAFDVNERTESVTVKVPHGAGRIVFRGFDHAAPIRNDAALWTMPINFASVGATSSARVASLFASATTAKPDLMIVRYSGTPSDAPAFEAAQRAANAASGAASKLVVFRRGGHHSVWLVASGLLLGDARARKEFTDDLRMSDAEFVAAVNGAR